MQRNAFLVKTLRSLEGTRNLNNSLTTVTALVPALGYKLAGEIAAQAHKTGQSVRAVVLELGLLEAHELDRLLSAEAATALGHR